MLQDDCAAGGIDLGTGLLVALELSGLAYAGFERGHLVLDAEKQF
jgi:hypothetical protein